VNFINAGIDRDSQNQGVYTTVMGGGGPMDAALQAANLQDKSLRGIQITNKDGSVQFDTIFPAYYSGRTNHIHRQLAEILNFSVELTIRSDDTPQPDRIGQ
jgi:hypothetical protein